MQGPCPYPWQVSYIAAVLETNPILRVSKIIEALAALEHRLLSPVEPGSAEETALKLAKVGLARLKADQWKVAS
jgi:hypothetical protein